MNIKYYIKSWPRVKIGKYAELFIPLYRIFGKHKQLLVNRRTDIVIEGYPRSANTFSVVAFEYSQTCKVDIAHHLHVPAQILYAVRKGIPVIVLLREPADAVSSLITRYPGTAISAVLHEYIGFYRAIVPVADKVVIGEFREVIENFGSVIARVNNKYGTSFKEYRNTLEDEKCVFSRIKLIHKEKGEQPNQIAIPTELKNISKGKIKQALNDQSVLDLLDLSRKYYRLLLSLD